MTSSYRQILRSTTIIGGASVINIVLSLLRMKAAALLLGPAGVGLIGLFSNMVGVAISLAGLGLGGAGTRQIAEAVGSNDQQSIAATRLALFWCSLIMAIFGSTVFWLLRGLIAVHVLRDISRASEVGWLALAVGLHIFAVYQGGALNGLRRIGDLSRISVYSGFLSSILGVYALWKWGTAGVIVYVGAVPLFMFLVGQWYVAKLPKIDSVTVPLSAIKAQSVIMVKLGISFMLVSSIGYMGQLLVRSLVQKELGIESLGYFQAASAISMTYVGFLVTAMGQDYYPRLTAVITEKTVAGKMMNEQIEVSLLLAGPLFIAMMALAPWVIQLLYSAKFYPAAEVLHWQIIGDMFKIAGWPIGYILLASGDGRTFVKNEIIFFISFSLLTWILLPVFGVAGSGISFLGMNVIMFCLVSWQAKKRMGFIMETATVRLLITLIISAIILIILARYSSIWTAIFGLIFSAFYAVYGFSRLAHKSELTGKLGSIATWAQGRMKKMGVWHE